MAQQGHFSDCTVPLKWPPHVTVCLLELEVVWYNTVWLYRWIGKPQDGLEMFLCKCPSPHAPGEAPPSLFVPRTLNISSSVSITLQNNQSSSYTLMSSLYIDLIEHTVDKVLRNPLGALLLPSQQYLIALLKPSNPFITSTLSLFFLFPLSLHSIISFPTPISVSILPLLSIQTPLLLLPLFTPPPHPPLSLLCSTLSCMYLLY